MKNILIVSAVFPPEPVVSAQISSALAESLYESGEKITVIAPYPSRPYGFEFKDNLNISNSINAFISKDRLECFYLPSYRYAKSGTLGRLKESISFGWACYNFIIKSDVKYDSVYMNTWPVFGQLGVAIACNKKGVPYTIHIMDIYPESMSQRLTLPFRTIVNALLMPIEKYILKKAKRVIAISNKMKEYLVKTRDLNAQKISVVYNWQDESNFIDIPSIAVNEKKVFMYLGNIGPVAGIPFLIESFSNLDAKLIIAGSGSHKDHCIEIANKYQHLDIEFLDVPAGKVAVVQSMADVMLLPIVNGAASTSIPSKLPAYMFSKKPVLVMAEVDSDSSLSVINAQCGWVEDYGNTNKLKNTIDSILKMEDVKLKKMGLAGYNYALENFSKSNNLNKLKMEILN
jgi:glycosyltransferase involved in cell wall biosynthesis